MNAPPKFAVGEFVRVESKFSPTYNVPVTQIVKIKRVYMICGYKGWGYQTSHQPDNTLWYREESIHPIPPDTGVKWEDCAWQPYKLMEREE